MTEVIRTEKHNAPPTVAGKPVKLTVLLPPEIRDRLRSAARADRRSLSGMAVLLIEEGMRHASAG